MKRHLLSVTLLSLTVFGACKKSIVNKDAMLESPAQAMAGTTTVSALNRLTFDWKTVPVGADIGDATRDFSTDEISFLTKQFKVLAIEKAQGSALFTEDGFITAAKAIKAANPSVAVLYYWNSWSFFDKYRATVNFNPDWLVPDVDPTEPPDFRIDIPACRTWWVNAAKEMAKNNSEVDGIFVDGLTSAYKSNPTAATALINELRDSLNKLSGTPRLIIYNCAVANSSRSTTALTDASGTNLHPLLQITDGAMFEDFYRNDLNRNVSTTDILHVLKGVQLAARNKKAIIFKAWPSFSFLDRDGFISSHTYEQQVAQSRNDISFPVAAFLVAAGKYSYLQYSWGWNHTAPTKDHGTFIRSAANSQTVDPTWYPELRRALGNPVGEAVINGNIWTRKFAHATVTADMNAKTGSITWSSLTYYPRG